MSDPGWWCAVAPSFCRISKPFDLFRRLSGPSVPVPYAYKYPLILPIAILNLKTPPHINLPSHPNATSIIIPPFYTLDTSCPPSSATQRVSGSSTFTGTFILNVVFGTRRDGVWTSMSAFVPTNLPLIPSLQTACIGAMSRADS